MNISLLLAKNIPQLLATTNDRFHDYWSTREPIPNYSLNPNIRSSCAAGERPLWGICNGYTDMEFYPPKNGGRIGI